MISIYPRFENDKSICSEETQNSHDVCRYFIGMSYLPMKFFFFSRFEVDFLPIRRE